MTQSAISKLLQRLRHELGDTLFVRTQKGMEPTPRAMALKGPITEILQTFYDQIVVAPDFDPVTSDRIFTIHASDLGISALIPGSHAISKPPRRVHDYTRFPQTRRK